MELQALLDLIAQIGTDSAPDDQTLRSARTELRTALNTALAGDDPDVEAGAAIRQAIDEIDAELAARTEDRAAQSARAAELLQGLDQEEEGPDDDEEEDGEEEAEEAAGDEAVTVNPAQLRTALTRTRVRAEANAEPEPESDMRALGMGPAAGAVTDPNLSLKDAADIFHRFNRHVGRNGRQALIRMEKTYPEERQFGTSVETNTEMVNAVAGHRAIVAAGGICGPLEADFSHPVCGDRGRPIRDALPAFQADRGGLRFAPSASIGDLSDAVTVWTVENDESPGVLTKACPHLTCPDEVEARVDAIVACLTVGNFQAKFNPEFWRSRLDLVMIEHDRIAEQTLFAQMQADAPNVTVAADSGGTAKENLRALRRAGAALRSRLRVDDSQRLQWIAPSWLREAMAGSITNNADDLDEYAVGAGQISAFLDAINIEAVWSPDLQVFGAQGAGALAAYPSTATTLLYPVGTYVFLDGGTLDLGIEITDSTLNETNDRQAFVETFEQATFRGCEALELVLPVEDDCSCVGAA